jgi:hypothetical protein
MTQESKKRPFRVCHAITRLAFIPLISPQAKDLRNMTGLSILLADCDWCGWESKILFGLHGQNSVWRHRRYTSKGILALSIVILLDYL